MMQQLSLSVGVGTGALLLHLSITARGGGHLMAGDFAPAFFTVGLLAATSMVTYLRLSPEASAEVSGHLSLPAGPRSADRRAQA